MPAQLVAIHCVHFLRAASARHAPIHHDHVEGAAPRAAPCVSSTLIEVVTSAPAPTSTSRSNSSTASSSSTSSTRPVSNDSRRAGRRRLRQRRFLARQQTDFDRRSALFPVARHDFSAMFLDDSVADAQSQASSLAHRLRGVERIENAARVLDPGTAVVELHAHERILLEDAHFQARRCRCLSTMASSALLMMFRKTCSN